MTQYWLVKSEESVYSIDDLRREPDQTTCWDGVRNYQARNFMRDGMKLGDQVFFYHSNCDAPGVVGVAEVVREAYPDHYAFDPQDKHFDPKSSAENPRWVMVDLRFVRAFERRVTLRRLQALKAQQPLLQEMPLLRRGNRLSVMPISKEQFDFINNFSL